MVKQPGWAGHRCRGRSQARRRRRRPGERCVARDVVEAGNPHGEPVLFLHGWPQSSLASSHAKSEPAGPCYSDRLPGFGESAGSKRAVAETVHSLAETMRLRNVTLVGHDAGAVVAYAYLRSFPDLKAAVIIDVAPAGVFPWEQLVQSQGTSHFGFHAIPSPPERLVQHHQRNYFNFFYDAFSLDPAKITATNGRAYVDAYASDAALTRASTGIEASRSTPTTTRKPADTGRARRRCYCSAASGPQAPSFIHGLRGGRPVQRRARRRRRNLSLHPRRSARTDLEPDRRFRRALDGAADIPDLARVGSAKTAEESYRRLMGSDQRACAAHAREGVVQGCANLLTRLVADICLH